MPSSTVGLIFGAHPGSFIFSADTMGINDIQYMKVQIQVNAGQVLNFCDPGESLKPHLPVYGLILWIGQVENLVIFFSF